MVSKKYSFFDLPSEIRQLIYYHVVADAQISVEQEPNQSSNTPVIHAYRNSSCRTDLLRVCKRLNAELFPILAGHTILLFQPGTRNPNEAIKIIPSDWLAQTRVVFNNARIRSRITHVLRQQHLDPAPFSNLRIYRVAHLVYPDWRESCHKTDDLESFVQTQLESEFFFQAGTLKLFTRTRTYSLTTTIWLLRAFVEESIGWEVDFSLDSWTVTSKRKAKFRRHKDTYISLCEDPKCRDYRNYDVTYLDT